MKQVRLFGELLLMEKQEESVPDSPVGQIAELAAAAAYKALPVSA